MLLKPNVRFKYNGEIKFGSIKMVDCNGTFFQTKESSYDIMVNKEQCLYKHIEESAIEGSYER